MVVGAVDAPFEVEESGLVVTTGAVHIGPARGHIKKEVVLRKSWPVAQNAGPSYKKTIPIIFS